LGIVSTLEGDNDKAKDYFIATLESDPTHKNAKIYLSDILIDKNMFQEGIELLHSVLSDEPGDIHALNRLGNLNLEAGKNKEAHEYFSRVLQFDPQNELAKNALSGIAI
jgi:tetratricopeptide (TPR) repeat protein